MGTILQMRPSNRRPAAAGGEPAKPCEIVIFPGVRIERHAMDLGRRDRKSVERSDFDGIGGSPRPRKTS
jgi:hypothetical protein